MENNSATDLQKLDAMLDQDIVKDYEKAQEVRHPEPIIRTDALRAVEMRLYAADQSQLERMIKIIYGMDVVIIDEYPDGVESRLNLFK